MEEDLVDEEPIKETIENKDVPQLESESIKPEKNALEEAVPLNKEEDNDEDGESKKKKT